MSKARPRRVVLRRNLTRSLAAAAAKTKERKR